jgi:hypothetical protein
MAKILTDVDAFSADVTVPEDADARNAASVESAFQKLANRTRFLLNLIYVATPATVVRFVGSAYQSSADSSGSLAGWLHLHASPTVALSIGSARAKRFIPFDHVLPNGATITQVRVYVDPAGAQATAGNRMSAQVFVGDITGTQYSSTETTDAGSAGAQWITISGLSIVVDKTQRTYGVAVLNASTYAADQIFGAEVTFTSSKKFVD